MKSFSGIIFFAIIYFIIGCSIKKTGNQEVINLQEKDTIVNGNGVRESVVTEKKESDISGTNQPLVMGSKLIIIYGSKTCEHCIRFIASLDSAGIKYRFLDVERDKTLFNEMLRKVQNANIKGYLSYPILDIDGRILVNPNFKEFIKLLK